MVEKIIQRAPEEMQASKPNLTGIPTQMKQEFEEKSGLPFDDVRVHYNSDKPARLGALAYTRGTQVHIGQGQEKYLRHELGHVVQQKQGIVTQTEKIAGLPINNEFWLETAANYTPVRKRLNVVQTDVIQCIKARRKMDGSYTTESGKPILLQRIDPKTRRHYFTRKNKKYDLDPKHIVFDYDASQDPTVLPLLKRKKGGFTFAAAEEKKLLLSGPFCKKNTSKS